VRCACIDVGSNTTRLLVADAALDSVTDVLNVRAFTLIGRSLGDAGVIPAAKVEETAAVVAEQAARARELGAEQVRVVATAAIRAAANAAELSTAIRSRAGVGVDVLDGAEEARLAFRGAAHAVGATGTLAVIDVGGGSTEIAIGRADGVVARAESIPVGSSALTDRHLHGDPPHPAELECVRDEVVRAFAPFEPPAVDHAVAVGGSASSLLHLAGGRLGPDELDRALEALCAHPAQEQASRFGLDPVRVRLLPAGVLILAHLARRLERPLRICKGGLREGVILEMMGAPR